MGRAGLGGEHRGQDFFPVVPVEVKGVALEKGQAENFVGGVFVPCPVRLRHDSIVGKARLCGEIGAGDKDNVVAFLYPVLQNIEFNVHRRKNLPLGERCRGLRDPR